MAAPLTQLSDRRSWTDEDTEVIVDMRRAGAVDADIIARLGCTASAFQMQVHRLMKDRSLDLPRANRPDWGQPWTDERDTLLVKLRNENLLHDDEISEVLGVTIQKARTRVDYLRDIGREVRGAKKGPKPGPRTKSPPKVAGAAAPPAALPVAVPVVTPSLGMDRTDRVASLRRDLARRRHASKDAAERSALGIRLLDVIDLEEAYAAAASAMAAADAMWALLQGEA